MINKSIVLGLLLMSQVALGIEVNPVLPGDRVTIEWDTPVTREDGTPLEAEELAGYKLSIHCKDSGQDETIVISDSSSVSYVFPSWDKLGSCNIGNRATDTDGIESQVSNLVTLVTGKPKSPPSSVTLTVDIPDAVQLLLSDCEVNVSCRVVKQ